MVARLLGLSDLAYAELESEARELVIESESKKSRPQKAGKKKAPKKKAAAKRLMGRPFLQLTVRRVMVPMAPVVPHRT